MFLPLKHIRILLYGVSHQNFSGYSSRLWAILSQVTWLRSCMKCDLSFSYKWNEFCVFCFLWYYCWTFNVLQFCKSSCNATLQWSLHHIIFTNNVHADILSEEEWKPHITLHHKRLLTYDMKNFTNKQSLWVECWQ